MEDGPWQEAVEKRYPRSSIFYPFKRRNVYKVAVAYAVVSWLLIQIATQVFPFFEVPNWAIHLVVLVLVLGFPVALVTTSSQSFSQQQNKNSYVY
jgi:hypothetical protein